MTNHPNIIRSLAWLKGEILIDIPEELIMQMNPEIERISPVNQRIFDRIGGILLLIFRTPESEAIFFNNPLSGFSDQARDILIDYFDTIQLSISDRDCYWDFTDSLIKSDQEAIKKAIKEIYTIESKID